MKGYAEFISSNNDDTEEIIELMQFLLKNIDQYKITRGEIIKVRENKEALDGNKKLVMTIEYTGGGCYGET